MEKIKLSTKNNQTIISLNADKFKIKVEKNRVLAPEAYGALIDVVQFKDNVHFQTVANYVFEGLDMHPDEEPTEDERSLFFDAIIFYFGSVVQSPNYRITIPEFSSFYGFSNGPISSRYNESLLGPELTKENCSPELWSEIGFDSSKIDDKDLPF